MKDYGMPFKNSAIDKMSGKFGQDPEKPNRGDRMVARGERMMANADVKLAERLASEAEKTSSRVDKLSNKYGEAPKLGQYNRLKSAKDQAGNAASKLTVYNEAKDYQKEYPDEAKGNEQFRWSSGRNSSEALKYNKGQAKIKKGEMLSKHINAKKR